MEALPLGVRVRQLRLAAGLTQTELAGDRFSKEYVSQIERGKTRPGRATIDWLARRLGVDPGFLADGISSDVRARLEATVARAEALLQAQRWEEAAEAFASTRADSAAAGAVEVEVRGRCGEARARMERGELHAANELLVAARELVEAPEFADVERAEVLFLLGVCRYKLSSVSTALGFLNQALELAERSGLPCDVLRSEILSWRSRCFRHQRDYQAARDDVERALELASGVGDRRTMANVYCQASLVAERMGRWVLARTYAERAKSYYEELNDGRNVAGLLNNLGGLNLMLGSPQKAVEYLKRSFAVALEADSTEDAAQAAGSLATVHLELGEHEQAARLAAQALELLGGRPDYLHEIGGSQLVLGHAMLEQGRLDEAERWFRQADASFEQLGQASYRARAWVALGDLAARRGDDRGAARLYRAAAEALQEVRF